jgi:peptidoglycan/xylan/chitin deacetylase (PgdA/CDA1 family)
MTPPSTATLLYHSVYRTLDTGDRYDIHAETFEDHVRIIREKGVHCIPPENIGNPEGRSVESGKQVILTFDDGRMDNHEIVFPILAEYAFRAFFFVNPDRVGTSGYMDWTHLADLDRHGMSIQSHGLSHRYLHLLPLRELERELKESKRAIEDRIGKQVDFLSVPGGFYSRDVTESAWSLGYRGMFTSDPGIDRIDRPVQATLFHRYNISRDTSRAEVADLLSQKIGIRFRHQAMHAVKGGARKVLGTEVYHRLWTNLRKYSR